MATSPSTTKSTGWAKYGDLKGRLIFLLLALVVYRIGAHVPVPGIDPDMLRQLFSEQQGGILGLFNMFSGGALSRFSVLLSASCRTFLHRLSCRCSRTCCRVLRRCVKKESRPSKDYPVHALRYVALGFFQAVGIAVALETQAGLVIDPGNVPLHVRREPRDGHHVPDVVG